MRIGIDQLAKLSADIEANPAHARFIGPQVIAAVVLDLRDAHEEINRLVGLSKTQAVALDRMEAGTL